VAGINTVELWHKTSEVEGELKITFGDEDDVEGDDEHEDNDGNVCEEAPNDLDVYIRQPLGVDSSTVRISNRLHSTSTAALEEDE
jgi:hypothetical protein